MNPTEPQGQSKLQPAFDYPMAWQIDCVLCELMKETILGFERGSWHLRESL